VSEANGRLFIHDGWTCKGRVDAVPGLHPAVEFTYRPATPRQRYEFQLAEAARKVDVACDLLCRLLVSVRVAGDDKEFQLQPAQAAQLPADVFSAMFDMAMCFVAPNVTTEQAEKN
jgi:hypothetical protein